MTDAIRLRNSFAEIHLGHLKHNCELLKRLVGPNTFFCPMVKADAYGHGDIEISKHLERHGVQYLGVSLIEEGVRLRLAGIRIPILSFSFFDQVAAEEIIRYSITPVVSSWEQIEKLKLALRGRTGYPIHIKFNTGMSRLGFDCEDAPRVAQYFAGSSDFLVEGLCTHLLNGEDAGEPNGRTTEQVARFQAALATLSFPKAKVHYANSAAMLSGVIPNMGGRPGLALYGVWPEFEKNRALDLKKQLKSDLRPVMQLKSSIGLVRKVQVGETVSYGGRWTATRPSTVGVIPIGYADGYHRSFTNKAHMLYRGMRVPVIGSVCMDYTMVDLTDAVSQGAAQTGDEVVLFGEQMGTQYPVDDLARLIGTISYEILTQIGKRIPRVFIEES